VSASSRRGGTVCPLCAVIVMSGGVCTSTEYHDRDDQKPLRGPEPGAGGLPRLAGEAAGGHRHAPLLHQVSAPFPRSGDPGADPRLFGRSPRAADGAALLSEMDLLGVAEQCVGVPDGHPGHLQKDRGEAEEPECTEEIGPPRGEGEPQDGGDGGKGAEQDRGGGEKSFPGDADHGRQGIWPVVPLPPPVEKRQDDRPVEKKLPRRRGRPGGRAVSSRNNEREKNEESSRRVFSTWVPPGGRRPRDAAASRNRRSRRGSSIGPLTVFRPPGAAPGRSAPRRAGTRRPRKR